MSTGCSHLCRRAPQLVALWSLVLHCVLGTPSIVRADDAPTPQAVQEAREQARKGLAHVQAKRWGEGRYFLRLALTTKETSVLLYYLGLCEAALDHQREAYRQLTRAIELAQSPGTTGESAEVRRQVLEDAVPLLRKVDSKLPQVKLRWAAPPPADATLVIDGEAVTIEEVDNKVVRLDAGDHELAVKASGKKPYRTSFRATEAQESEVIIALEEEPAAIEYAPPPPPRPAPLERPKGAGWQRPVGYLGLGLGAALLGAGVYSSLRVAATNDDLRSAPEFAAYRASFPAGQRTCAIAQDGSTASASGAASAGEVRDACDEAKRFATLQYVFYAGGLALAGAGAYFAFFAPAREKSAPRALWRLAPALGPRRASVDFIATF